MNIRKARVTDTEEILKVYAPYVERTAITFEYEVPSVEEFRGRIEKTLRKYPYLVAEEEGRIVGYAYAGPFKERDAYEFCVETSIYVAWDERGKGYGRQLHDKLEAALKEQGILNMNACIAYTEEADEFLPVGSVPFHESLGYSRAAHFHKCGWKQGRWYDMIWMEKMIGSHTIPSQEGKE